MRVLPLLVFAAAAGVSSGVMSFKHTSQLSYDNAMLALQVRDLERKVAGLRNGGVRPRVFTAAERRVRPPAARESSRDGGRRR